MFTTERSPAVVIDNVVKSYDSHHVLNGLHMSVEQGTIYGLLGPSGCGKTTVLGCIVGICGMNSGQIQLGIQTKTQLGYMPQDSGLFGELTSEETFYFHGRINFMTEGAIKSRIQDLAKLLDLPKITALIKNFSGGQQRRISLAVALLHDPQLLLLDEPTVGLDPLLRHSIWEHLKQLVMIQHKTILLTTHYIEEARFADTVGFMLNGVLLEEDSPHHIMENYRLNSLEETFLHLSTQNSKFVSESRPKPIKDRKKSQTVCSPLLKISSFSTHRLTAQILKNFIWFKRNYALFFYLGILAPILYSVLLYETIGQRPFGLKVGTIHVGGPMTCDNQYTVSCNSSVGCRLVENLRQKSYQVTEYSTEKAGLDALVHNDIWAMLTFPLDLASSLSELSLSGLRIEDDLIASSTFNVSMDMSNSIIGSQIMKDIRDGFYDVLSEHFMDCGWSAGNFRPPIKFNDPVFGRNDVQFTAYVFPGLICLFPFLFACLFSMATVLVEKITGVIERSMVSGLLWSEFLIAHIIVVLMLLVLNVAAPYIIIFGFYNEIHRGSFIVSYIITYLQGVCGMCCGILIAVVCNVETVATQTLVTLMFLCTYGTGAMWPLEGMHWVARLFSFCLPTTIPLQSVRHVIDHGWSITYYQVWKGVIFSVLWSLVFLLFGSYIMYRKTKLLK